MLNTAQKNIIIRAMARRAAAGDDVKEILKTYKNLSDEEKYEVLTAIGNEEPVIEETDIEPEPAEDLEEETE